MNDDVLKDSLRDLYERAPCGYIFTLPDGTILRVNQTFLDWTGYARDKLISVARFQDLLTVPGKIFYENQYAPLLRMQGFVREVAFDLVRRDGEPLPVLVNSVEQPGADGPSALVASTIFDATDRRRYERELLVARRRAEQLAAIVTQATDAILGITPDGIIETWNPAATRLFRHSEQDTAPRQLSDVLQLPGGADYERTMAELRAGRAVQVEAQALREDGTRVDVSAALAPHAGLLGELIAISAIIRDISERKALERLQQEFLAMASHELRNPLSTIRGFAQLMRRQGRYDEHAVNTMIAQSGQLGRLIDDLLLASQIAAERLDLRLAPIDLAAEAQAAVEHQRVIRAAIRIEVPDAPIYVMSDRQRLGQVFANLLTNAVKYSPDETEILVRVARAGDTAIVEVIDRGVGIPSDALPYLFDRFYRVAGTAQRAQGLGLGLYITRRLIESHGGTIRVESEPGRGSIFTITLPLLAREPEGE